MKKICRIFFICICFLFCSKMDVKAGNEFYQQLLEQMIPKNMVILEEDDLNKENLKLTEEGTTFTVEFAMRNLKQWRVSEIFIYWEFDDYNWDDEQHKMHTNEVVVEQEFDENYEVSEGRYSVKASLDKYVSVGKYYPTLVVITYVNKNNPKVVEKVYGEWEMYDLIHWYFEEGDDEESENSINYASVCTDYEGELDFEITETVVDDDVLPEIKNVAAAYVDVFNKNNPPKVNITVEEKGSGIKTIEMYVESDDYEDIMFLFENKKDEQFLGTHTYELEIDPYALRRIDDGCCKIKEIYVTDYALNRKVTTSNLKFYYCDHHKIQNVTKRATNLKKGYSQKQCVSCGMIEKGSKVIIPQIKTVKLSKDSYVYDGKIKKPSITVKDSNEKKLKRNTDYTLSYSKGRKNVGLYKVKVTFKGKYKGTVTKTFKIKPRATGIHKISRSRRAITVKWYKRNKQISGYQICYGRSTNKEKCKKITVKSYKTTSKKITGLTKNKKYYVWVRTYKTVNGTRYYSAWSKRKNVTVR